jgi:hypothetical protein
MLEMGGVRWTLQLRESAEEIACAHLEDAVEVGEAREVGMCQLARLRPLRGY